MAIVASVSETVVVRFQQIFQMLNDLRHLSNVLKGIIKPSDLE